MSESSAILTAEITKLRAELAEAKDVLRGVIAEYVEMEYAGAWDGASLELKARALLNPPQNQYGAYVYADLPEKG